jgi:threonine aldolase
VNVRGTIQQSEHMDKIDLRSDTVTWPTPNMRRAMAEAVVGDDVYGEDPTVIELEAEAAQLLGKEAGLFVTSGTQGNLAAILAYCRRGEEIILGDKAHTFVYEAGGVAAVGGIHPHTVPVQADGTLRLEDIRSAIRGDNEHFPRTRLICLENTQGTVGGVPLSKEYTDQVAAIARERGLSLHIDGARLFNAAAALGIPARELVAGADSVTFCLSKGLCAPVGSLLVGQADFIKEARRARKQLGGGLRQVGVLAAAGLIAIREMIDRLGEDHANACHLGDALASIPGIKVQSIHTNFVFFELREDAALSPAELIDELKARDIIIAPYPGHTRLFRAVTHYWITPERVQQVAGVMKTLLS